MKIYIPTLGRAGRVKTLDSIPNLWWPKTYLVVSSAKEMKEYEKAADKPVNILVCPKKGIAATRQWIIDSAKQQGSDQVLMLDDDMEFAHRMAGGGTKLYASEHKDVNRLFSLVQKLLKRYPAVGISARQGNQHKEEDIVECTRMMNAYAFNTEVLKNNNIRFDKTKVMEDFHVTLSLLELGYKNAVIYSHCWNQRSSGAAGGCSTYRTPKMQADAANQIAKLHAPFVKVVTKESKSSWKGMEERTDVIIYWKKCFEASKRT